MTTVFQPVSWGDPFRDLRRFQDDLNRLFTAWPSPRAREFPPLNLWANEAGIVVAATAVVARVPVRRVLRESSMLARQPRRGDARGVARMTTG